MIGFNEVASKFRFGHAVTKTRPLLWEENANSTGYPVELPGCVSGDAEKHHFSHSMGMQFGVSKRQGRSPGPAKHQPPLDLEAPPQQFDICEEMGRRVAREIYVWVARVRRASSGSALVEQNDPIDVGIKRPPRARGAARTRSAMEHERRLAGGIAARFPIQLVPITGVEHSVIVGLNIWI